MKPRGKTTLGALALCALSICAFATASASAAGLTAVECQEQVGGKYNTSQCLTPAVAGNLETKVIEGKKEVEGRGTRTTGAGHGLGSTDSPVAVFHIGG